MKLTIRDLIAVIVLFALSIATWQAKREVAKYQSGLTTLKTEIGFIEPESPDKIYVRQLASPIVNEWNFRVHVPEGDLCEFVWSHNFDGEAGFRDFPALTEGQHCVRVSVHDILARKEDNGGRKDWVIFRADSGENQLSSFHTEPKIAWQVRNSSDYYNNASVYEDFASLSKVVDEFESGEPVLLLRIESEDKESWVELKMTSLPFAAAQSAGRFRMRRNYTGSDLIWEESVRQ